MKLRHIILILLLAAAALLLVLLPCAHAASAQEAARKPAEKPAQGNVEEPGASAPAQNPAQIELLETKYRFESNGDSRKEVHARVKINSELGVRQFARLNFDYNRSFESVEIPLIRITHESGGTAEILPGAITDQPNPAVVNAPAYQDVRVKTVRILGLAPGDNFEYRVITTVSKHPLAPDFWLDHSFDRTGVVTQEIFELDLPANRPPQVRASEHLPAASSETTGEGKDARRLLRWKLAEKEIAVPTDGEAAISVTSFPSWNVLSSVLSLRFLARSIRGDEVYAKAAELTRGSATPERTLHALYEFASQKIRTVDLPLGAMGFSVRPLADVISSGYAIPEEKAFLLAELAKQAGFTADTVLASAPDRVSGGLPSPLSFTRVLTRVGGSRNARWLDPSLEVAPIGVIPANLRGKRGLLLSPVPEGLAESDALWPAVTADLPFAATQRVNVDASLSANGSLTTRVKYELRGDNELLLRIAFHQQPRDKWKDLAQLLALSDGFRGQVSNVSASDPYATREPFTLDYEITMPKFVDWSNKPVRIPALLPQLGLPDPAAKAAAGAGASPIELGTPLEVETHMTLRLPPGTTALTPTGTTVKRDYATFASQYSTKGPAITASRHIHFLLREIPAARATDYNAFLRAVQSDETQDFTLDRKDSAAHRTKPVAPKPPAPTQAARPEP